MFSRAWNLLHVLSHLEPAECFPHLEPVTYFSAPGNGYIFFSRLETVADLPVHGIASIASLLCYSEYFCYDFVISGRKLEQLRC